MNKKETIYSIGDYVEAVYPHFDVITFNCDSDVTFLDIKKLSNPDPHPDPKKKRSLARIQKESNKFGACCYKIKLFQPTRENIEYLIEAIKHEAVIIYASYTEVTYDFISKEANKLASLIARHFVVTKTHNPYYHNHKGTHYWERRKSNASKMIPVLYSDRLSKVAGKSCAHFELKLGGKLQCEKNQLSTPQDFLQFDFIEFFVNNTRFYVPPSKTDLGSLIDMDLNQSCKTARAKQKLFDRVAEEQFELKVDDPIQKMFTQLPDLKNYYSSRAKTRNNKQFTLDFQKALLSNVKPY